LKSARLGAGLRAAAQATVLGVFPLVAGVLLERPLGDWLYGDWLLAAGPFLAGLLVALLQEAARLPAAALLGWLCGRLLAERAGPVVLASLLVGYLYYLLLRLMLDTASQLCEPGYLGGKLLGAAGICVLGVWLARRSSQGNAPVDRA